MTPFNTAVLVWFARSGRRDLPWQKNISPYRVWVSEVMLQQTQVPTVIPYFVRFIQEFPDATALADASLDEVLYLWAGLGYYARARNLHKAAQQIRDSHGGELPNQLDALRSLPGIGRSTAGAILAIGFNLHGVILDGNVKRLLARYFEVSGHLGQSATEKKLWCYAQDLTPDRQIAAYTQAIMDIGATVCVRGEPRCPVCPVRSGCAARKSGQQSRLPTPAPKKQKPTRRAFVMVLQANQGILLERRPETGIWGGLWSLPEMTAPSAWPDWLDTALIATGSELLPSVRHEFTHFKLNLTPVRLRVEKAPLFVCDRPVRWYQGKGSQQGMPAPIKKLLEPLLPAL